MSQHLLQAKCSVGMHAEASGRQIGNTCISHAPFRHSLHVLSYWWGERKKRKHCTFIVECRCLNRGDPPGLHAQGCTDTCKPSAIRGTCRYSKQSQGPGTWQRGTKTSHYDRELRHAHCHAQVLSKLEENLRGEQRAFTEHEYITYKHLLTPIQVRSPITLACTAPLWSSSRRFVPCWTAKLTPSRCMKSCLLMPMQLACVKLAFHDNRNKCTKCMTPCWKAVLG